MTNNLPSMKEYRRNILAAFTIEQMDRGYQGLIRGALELADGYYQTDTMLARFMFTMETE